MVSPKVPVQGIVPSTSPMGKTAYKTNQTYLKLWVSKVGDKSSDFSRKNLTITIEVQPGKASIQIKLRTAFTHDNLFFLKDSDLLLTHSQQILKDILVMFSEQWSVPVQFR